MSKEEFTEILEKLLDQVNEVVDGLEIRSGTLPHSRPTRLPERHTEPLRGRWWQAQGKR